MRQQNCPAMLSLRSSARMNPRAVTPASDGVVSVPILLVAYWFGGSLGQARAARAVGDTSTMTPQGGSAKPAQPSHLFRQSRQERQSRAQVARVRQAACVNRRAAPAPLP